MDGLLVDSEPLWTIAEEGLAAELGGTWSEDIKAQVVGTRLDVAVPRILGYYGRPPEDAPRAAEWLLRRVVELFAGPVTVLPGVRELLGAVRAEGVPSALVSSSYRVLVDAVLRHDFPFDLTIAGDEVARGKPDPEPYLTAASRLGVDPARCVVLEDSGAGVASGLAAGCAVVAVPSVAGVRVAAGPRTLVRSSLVGLTTSDLDALLG